ncbi:MAG: right-handed parallel beta-helix repeat-containing protein, partial [Actinomycetota bacterium]|nr:right-handed parallel beta-helix repeat-containing protein [Actinomycetota bacterium]
MRLRVNGASGSSETWLDGTRIQELSKTENFGATPIGRIQLADNSTGRTFDVAFDDVVAATSFIQDDGGPDTTPPTAPGNLTATAPGPKRVDLSWSASRDNRGVAGYEILRDGAALANVGAATTYSDAMVAPSTTYRYEVRARDAAGNLSELSNKATVTTPETAASRFAVRKDGTSFIAESPTKTYTGALKSVVESAVYDLNVSGGGTVEFQAGLFDLGPDYFRLEEITGITFEGQGMDATVIQNYSTASDDTEPFNFKGAYSVVIRDLTVSAGGSARTTSDAIDFDKGNNSLVERVKVTSSRGKGIIFDGKDAGWTSEGNVVRDCIIDGTPNDGIQLLASSNNRVEGCTITNTVRDGIEVTKSQTIHAQPNKKSNDNVIIGNVIDNAGENGIRVHSSDRNRISGNRVTNSSDDRTGQDGIRITSSDSITCDDNLVEQNVATDTQAKKTQAYGLNINSSLCNRTSVGTNDFTGNQTGEIKDVGTDTRYGTDTDAPTTPTNLVATAARHDKIDLSWSASTDNVGVTGYHIFRDGALLASAGTETTYSDTTVSPSTTYTYQVRAKDAAGNLSALSDAATATTPPAPDTEAPTTPENVSADAISPTRADLSWSASSDNVAVTGYDILRDGTLLNSVGAKTAYSDTTAEPSTTYSYRVRAQDAAGNVSALSE